MRGNEKLWWMLTGGKEPLDPLARRVFDLKGNETGQGKAFHCRTQDASRHTEVRRRTEWNDDQTERSKNASHHKIHLHGGGRTMTCRRGYHLSDRERLVCRPNQRRRPSALPPELSVRLHQLTKSTQAGNIDSGFGGVSAPPAAFDRLAHRHYA